jgi:hypothetical protein
MDFRKNSSYNKKGMKKIKIFGLATRNLKRKFIRTLVLLLIVAVVTGTLLGATIFISGMQNALKLGTYRLGADILVVPEKTRPRQGGSAFRRAYQLLYTDIFVAVKAIAPVFIQPSLYLLL